jgi:hypothetical protein
MVSALAAGSFCVASSAVASGQSVGPVLSGSIVGILDGISYDGAQSFVLGWACQRGSGKSIAVRLFDDHRTLLTAGMANLYSEGAVSHACQDHEEGSHRFFIVLPIGFDRTTTLSAEGFIIGGTERAALEGSGTPLKRLPMEASFPPPPPPSLSGSYHSLGEHPRVFLTAEELKDAALRTNRPGSYSKERFDELRSRVAQDLSADFDWDATYSGCIGAVYQHALSVEKTGGDDDAIDKVVRSALRVKPNFKVRRGVFIIASRLALYAALVKAGAAIPAGAPNPDQAVALARRILLVWADHGLPRDAHGHFLGLAAISCEQSGKVTFLGAQGPALEFGAVVHSVHAQDLLQFLGALSADEEGRLNAFHSAMFDIIREAHNVKFGYGGVRFPSTPGGRYNNVDALALGNLLAIARLGNDARKLDAVLNGGDPAIPVLLPWRRFFDRAIYGAGDHPLDCSLEGVLCPHNPKDPDKYPYFQTAVVAPGEVVDRIRNESPLNSIGYSVGVLRSLIGASEILRLSGFDSFAYHGSRRQSIEMAVQYYACFGREAGFYKTVTLSNSSACADVAQYDGKIVNDVDRVVIYGAYRFPDNSSIANLEASAKIASRQFPLDTLVFGRWHD